MFWFRVAVVAVVLVAVLEAVVCAQVVTDQDALYVLHQLKNLSDSGIYDTLQITNVLSKHTSDGLYHVNTVMQLELESPYFLSGQKTEQFEFVLMVHKVDQVRSMAIDEFPRMQRWMVEEFSTRRKKSRSLQRNEAFWRLEVEDVAKTMSGEQEALSLEVVFETIDTLFPVIAQERNKNISDRTKRITEEAIAKQEEKLKDVSLRQLLILHRDFALSQYTRGRVKQLIDFSLDLLQPATV